MEIINSDYFWIVVFSNINEDRKLKIIQYNKRLQNLLKINIMNYRIFSGKYIVYESTTKGKIYDGYNDELLFEGEFLNSKKNGKGKEYDKYGHILFEGEYLNGKKNGKGKAYDKYGHVLFEGEYLNGKRQKGKEYDNDGNLKCEFEYLNGKLWNMKEYDKNGNIINELYKGEGIIKKYDDKNIIAQYGYLNGEKNGKGMEYYEKGGLKKESEYLNGILLHMKKYDENHNIISQYEYLKGENKGKHKKYYPKGGLKYEAEYLYMVNYGM